MKIRSILTIKYAGITATIFLVFMATIYCVNEHLRSDSFYRSLRSEAITKAHLFLNNQVDVETMQSIYLNNRQFIDEVEVAVYTPDFRILYHDALHNDIIKETPGMIDEIVRKKEIDFRTGDYQGIGILYEFGGKNYVVTAAAYDRYGHINQVIMTRLLLLLSIGGLSVLVIVGYMLAKSSLAPIRSIVRKAEGITVTQIDERLPVKNEHDELGELALAFNALLDRVEKTFNDQRMFVSNVSHELRTPMAALSAELDLALQKERTVTQYQNSIHNALQDSQRVIELIDGLLNLAKADYYPEQIKKEEIRLDELLLDANATVTMAHSRTRNLGEVTRRADILVVAIGRPKFVTADMVRDGAVVIDVGVNRDPETGKLCGDVDFEACEPKASLITKVPGGVGPMTIACLIENTIEAFLKKVAK